MTDLVLERAEREVSEGHIPGCQIALAHSGGLLAFEAFGTSTTATRSVIWSCTKALVAGAVWSLVGDGLLETEREVTHYVPEFGTFGKDAVTVDDLLLHTAGFPWAVVRPGQWSTSAGRCEAFAAWRLRWAPGSRFQYHPFSAHWVLAEIIERTAGEDYRAAVHHRVTDPSGLTRLRLGIAADDQHDIVDQTVAGRATTPEEHRAAGLPHRDPEEPLAAPEGMLFMNDPRARAAGIPGAGATGSAADVALLYQAFLTNPARRWDPDVLHDGTQVVRNTHGDPAKDGVPVNRTRGLVVAGDDGCSYLRHNFGRTVSPRTFGHDGAAGQIAWADPETGLSFCFLTTGEDLDAVRKHRRGEDLSGLAAQVRP